MLHWGWQFHPGPLALRSSQGIFHRSFLLSQSRVHTVRWPYRSRKSRFRINNIEACEDITSVIAERAVNYCSEGRVRYLCIQDGVGRAYVEGSKWYRVDFRFSEGMMTDIYCDCPYSELCKHEVAVAITLKMLFKQPQFKNAGDFIALDRWLFWQLASRAETIDI